MCTDPDVVCLSPDGESQGEIGRRHAIPSPLRPLDEPEEAAPRPLAKPQRLELGRIAQAIEIDVENGETRHLMEFEQRVRWAPDRACHAKSLEDAAREGGLAGAELAGQVHDSEGLRVRSRTRESSAQPLGLLRAVGFYLHETARG